MSGADGVALSPATAEGMPDLRAVVGAQSSDAGGPVTIEAFPAFWLRIDVRGKPHQTVMVQNTGAEDLLVTLRWYVNDLDWVEQYNVLAGVTSFVDRQRAAHHLAVELQAVQNTTQAQAAAVATI